MANGSKSHDNTLPESPCPNLSYLSAILRSIPSSDDARRINVTVGRWRVFSVSLSTSVWAFSDLFRCSGLLRRDEFMGSGTSVPNSWLRGTASSGISGMGGFSGSGPVSTTFDLNLISLRIDGRRNLKLRWRSVKTELLKSNTMKVKTMILHLEVLVNFNT